MIPIMNINVGLLGKNPAFEISGVREDGRPVYIQLTVQTATMIAEDLLDYVRQLAIEAPNKSATVAVDKWIDEHEGVTQR